MSEIVLCSQPVEANYLNHSCGIDPNLIQGQACSKPSRLNPYTPYLIGQELSAFDSQLIATLSTPSVASGLTDLSLSFGADNTVAMAEMTKKLHELNVGLIGASTSVYSNRLGGFAGAVKKYQDALMAYRSAVKSNTAAKILAKQEAFKAFQNLQIRFKFELNAINTGVRARRGTPLSSATRATNIARSSRHVTRLNVTSQIEANNLVKFTRHAKFLGNGLAVIDFTSRVGNIRNEYKSGGEWERELFIESSSFAASAGSGIISVNVGAAALGVFLAATPAGWMGLIVGGALVAGTSAAVSLGVNNYTKKNSGRIYDRIIKWIRSW